MKTAKPRPVFKKEDVFFHPEQKVFVVVDGMTFQGHEKGWLYALKVFNHETMAAGKPWKRYYEHKMLDVLTKMKAKNGCKVLFADK